MWSRPTRDTWNDGIFEVARVCGAGQRCLGDLRVFGGKNWGATRGRNSAVRRKASMVRRIGGEVYGTRAREGLRVGLVGRTEDVTWCKVLRAAAETARAVSSQ